MEVTLGTGLTDVAGNALARPFGVGFWTQTSSASVLSTVPADGATGVTRNTNVRMMFSHPMIVSSVESAIAVDVGAGNTAPGFNVSQGAEDWLVMTFDAELPADQAVTITVASSAQSADPVPTDEPAIFSFTTGAGLDTTPPELLSVTPALTGAIPSSTPSLVFRFSEPVDPNSFQPSRLGAQFMLLIEGFQISPIWSDDDTVLTLPLPAPLPSGLPIVADFGGFTDTAGNLARRNRRARSEGRRGRHRLALRRRDDHHDPRRGAGERNDRRFPRRMDGDPTDRGAVGRSLPRDRLPRPTFQQPGDYEIFRPTTSGIEFVGFGSEDPEDLHAVTFDTPVQYLSLPLAVGTWSGQTTATFEGETVTISYSVEVIEQVTLEARLGESFEGSSPPLVSKADDGEPVLEWIDAWRTELSYEMSIGGTPLESGTDEIHYAPVIGPVRWVSQGTDHTEDESWSSIQDLVGVDMDW